MKSIYYTALLAAAALGVAFAPATHAATEAPNIISFSDPSKPGTLKIHAARGNLRIHGADTTEVAVTSDIKPSNQKRKDGLRVLTTAASYSLTEKDNVVVLDAVSEGWKSGAADFTIAVPRGTHVIVQSTFGGDVTCAGVTGDLEITNMNGKIRLDDVSGGLVVQTMNGEIKANIVQLTEGKPLSFTSMNGEVSLRLPAAAKANLRFRTQNGSVLTDFPEAALVTKTETSARTGSTNSNFNYNSNHNGGIWSAEARQAFREAGRVAAEAAREIEAAVREAAEAAREGVAAAREGAAAARAAEAEARAEESTRPSTPVPPKPPIAPRMPKVPVVPTITGGKLLTGTLNGGGPEISVATMNGDVILRQMEE